jgi:hypothetical protein
MIITYLTTCIFTCIFIPIATNPRCESNFRIIAMRFLSDYEVNLDSFIPELLQASVNPELREDLHKVLQSCVHTELIPQKLAKMDCATIDIGFVVEHLKYEAKRDTYRKIFLYRIISHYPKYAVLAIDTFLYEQELSLQDQIILHFILLDANNNNLACHIIEVLSDKTAPSLLLAITILKRITKLDPDDPNQILLLHAIMDLGKYRAWCISRIDLSPLLLNNDRIITLNALQLILENGPNIKYLPHGLLLIFHSDIQIQKNALCLTLTTLYSTLFRNIFW